VASTSVIVSAGSQRTVTTVIILLHAAFDIPADCSSHPSKWRGTFRSGIIDIFCWVGAAGFLERFCAPGLQLFVGASYKIDPEDSLGPLTTFQRSFDTMHTELRVESSHLEFSPWLL
jgi:hypothetical protein